MTVYCEAFVFPTIYMCIGDDADGDGGRIDATLHARTRSVRERYIGLPAGMNVCLVGRMVGVRAVIWYYRRRRPTPTPAALDSAAYDRARRCRRC